MKHMKEMPTKFAGRNVILGNIFPGSKFEKSFLGVIVCEDPNDYWKCSVHTIGAEVDGDWEGWNGAYRQTRKEAEEEFRRRLGWL